MAFSNVFLADGGVTAKSAKPKDQQQNQPNTPGGTPPNQTNSPTPQGQGTSLPYAGVYLEQQNSAEKAYENAQTQLLATRNSLYHRYGLTDTGAVDPYSRYGDYQVMLGREGADLDAAREDAVGRGLGSGGLANQAQSALKQQDGAEQLDFQNQVLGADSDYRTGLAQALASKNLAFQQAEEQANQDAINFMLANGYFTQAAPATAPPMDDTSANTQSKAVTDAKKKLAKHVAKAGGARMLKL